MSSLESIRLRGRVEEVPPVKRIVLDRPPTAVPPPELDGDGAPRRRPAVAGPERLRLQGVSVQLRRQGRRQRRLAVGPSGRGARADRTVGLRQDDAAAHAQPSHRADTGGHARGRRAARRRGGARAARHRPACAGVDGLSAAQPLPDVDLRQRRLRTSRAVAQAPAPARDRTAGARCAAPRRAV